MANAWVDQIRPGDYISIGDVSEGIVTSTVVNKEPPVGAWLMVLSIHVGDDGYADFEAMDEAGTLYAIEIPNAERITARIDNDNNE